MKCDDVVPGGGMIMAITTPERGWIMLCSHIFFILEPTVEGQGQDQSGNYISEMRAMSDTLLHEFLHALYGTHSKQASFLSGVSRLTNA